MEFNTQSNPIHTILAADEFQVLKEELEADGIIQVNVVAKDEYVPEVERQNRIRSIVQTLPCTKIPKKI